MKKYLDIKPKPIAIPSNPQSRPPSAQSTRSNDGKLPPLQFSSSTSALKSTAGGSSTQAVPTSRVHMRSASSSDLAGSTAQSTAIARQRQISGDRRHVAAPSGRSAAGRTDMPPPSIVPSRSGANIGAAGDMGKGRVQGITKDSSDDRLFQSTPAEAPSRSATSTSTTASRQVDSGPFRPQAQGSTSGPRRPVVRQDVPQDPPGRSRTGPIRPVSSMAAMPPSRQEVAERPHRVVGGARRVPRVLPPEPEPQPAAVPEVKRGGDNAERKPQAPLGPAKRSRSAEPRGGVPAKVAVVPKTRQVKPAVPKANERAKPIPKAETTQRAGVSHGSTTAQKGRSDKTLPPKRGGHAPSGSRDATAVAAESKENKREGGDEVSQSATQPTEIPLPPSPHHDAAPALPPTDVPYLRAHSRLRALQPRPRSMLPTIQRRPTVHPAPFSVSPPSRRHPYLRSSLT
ncbi:uncharacterized protein B0H18DRAFT_412757 [Fomitopsis serialis]|uniref:uncharacterized protein n=1 Tax=Fomitopsis serialis TaxID=139415 RepID=UPI0020085754|nr:uncharacterized protein B0H18DRAFT_412757 [Neoantrodia serialis]KAH9935439.1 hypothetical protein B0H18DRAFT_412757 [Neoantrodia serialis]